MSTMQAIIDAKIQGFTTDEIFGRIQSASGSHPNRLQQIYLAFGRLNLNLQASIQRGGDSHHHQLCEDESAAYKRLLHAVKCD